jgi:hypothetical protein
MGLTYSQWRDMVTALGCPERAVEHPAASGRSEGDVLRERFGITEDVPTSKAPDDGMNKTELTFARTLGTHILKDPYHRWAREPVKVRLAGRTWYTPDFGVWFPYAPDEPFTLIEVKGFMRDDAAVKLKVAASIYPEWRWLLARREGRHDWDVRQVTNRGIGTSPIRVSWIHGA